MAFIEVEMRLRQCSQKIRVVPNLAGGAHVLFPSSGTTVAVRVYNPTAIENMEKKYSKEIKANIKGRMSTFLPNEMDCCNNNQRDGSDELFPIGGAEGDVDVGVGTTNDDIDGICSFQNSFKHSVVFFMLTNNDLMSDQLGRFESIVNALQRCLSEGACQNYED